MTARENPFASHLIENLSFRFPPNESWETLLKRLAAQEYCGAIVGPHGTGKTTLLKQLAPRLEALGFAPRLISLSTESGMREKERLPDQLRGVAKPVFILLDGAEQLSTRHWLPVRAAASQAAGFVVAVHRVSRLPQVLTCETTPALLEEMVQDLAGGSLPSSEADALLSRHRGNLREVFRELHDRWDGGEALIDPERGVEHKA